MCRGFLIFSREAVMKKFSQRILPCLVAVGMGLAAVGSVQGAETLQDVMKRRNLSQQDLLAAAKTYVPTGGRDEFVAFSSGGQSGQIIVYGIPSMRILKYIGVFTPEPWQGYGFDEESKAVLARAGSTARTSPGAIRTIRRSPRPTANTTASSCSSTTRPTRGLP
jgi:nitrous oxide reductase